MQSFEGLIIAYPAVRRASKAVFYDKAERFYKKDYLWNMEKNSNFSQIYVEETEPDKVAINYYGSQGRSPRSPQTVNYSAGQQVGSIMAKSCRK